MNAYQTLLPVHFLFALVVWCDAGKPLAATVADFTNSVIAIDSTGTDSVDAVGSFSLGTQFSLDKEVLVDGLGYFDVDSDGLSQSHAVGIFAINGELRVGPLSISSGSVLRESQSEAGDWRFEALLTPVSLLPGDYVIAGYTGGGLDDSVGEGERISVPGVGVAQGRRFQASRSLEYPGRTTAQPYLTASFSVVIPEPCGLCFACSSLLLACFRTRTGR
ncbi:MAG: hypothetical protein AAGJ46_01235 [Planctomycetota bacterium]